MSSLARFTTGPPPGVIAVVHHPAARMRIYDGLIALGVVLLLAGVGVVVRRPRAVPVPVPEKAAA